jgi:hypothetical protein
MHLCQYGLVMHDPNGDDDTTDAAQHLPPTTLPISEILADVNRQLVDSPREASQHLPPPTLPLSDVDRQLVDYPVEMASEPYEAGEMTNADEEAIARMDLHIKSILAGSSSRLFVLNTALGHNLPLPPLTEASIHNEIAEMYAAYYGGSSDDDGDETETEVRWATQPHIAKMYATPTTTSHLD